MIEVLGLEDIAEEHVELKRLLINTQQLAILNIQNGISHIETYIEYRENIENYYHILYFFCPISVCSVCPKHSPNTFFGCVLAEDVGNFWKT